MGAWPAAQVASSHPLGPEPVGTGKWMGMVSVLDRHWRQMRCVAWAADKWGETGLLVGTKASSYLLERRDEKMKRSPFAHPYVIDF